ncbi:MAG: UDP-galactopyranose mutase [Nitrospirota bacterium]
MYDFLIVGCGFSGSTLAERIASQLDKKVLIIDKRNHIGGNAYDHYDNNGVLISKYGPHIFHTNNKSVWNYISQFTEFNDYVHYVDAFVEGKFYALPLNINTINDFFKKKLSSKELPKFLNKIREPIVNPQNSEEAIVSKVGWDLYNAFYKNYTKKQWGIDPIQLDASVTLRLPIRMNNDKRYFTDKWQGLPKEGFTKIFQRMLDHHNIHILLNTDFRNIVNEVVFDKLVYTGTIDSFFNYYFGQLPYRSLNFQFERYAKEYHQHTGVINYPNNYEFTRIVEYKYLYKQEISNTTISKEYPCWNDDEPYYPVPSYENRARYKLYQQTADKLQNVYFCGRLGTYQYLNMDQCIAQALNLFENKLSA